MVSGHQAALQLVSERATAAKALKVQMLPVAGAFHTSLMQPAAASLEKVRWAFEDRRAGRERFGLTTPPTPLSPQVLKEVTIQKPSFPVFSNVTSQPFPSDPDKIRALLTRQLLEPVLWEATLGSIQAAGKLQRC